MDIKNFKKAMTNDIPVVIIGGGFAGVSTAYQLAKKGIESLIVEAGKIGEGNDEYPAGTTSPAKPNFSKWITHAFDSDHDEFVKIHGIEGARTFLELTELGTQLIKEITQDNIPLIDSSKIIRKLGSIVVAENNEQMTYLREEFEKYLDLGFGLNYRLLSNNQLNAKMGLDTNFSGGLFVPSGAMLNQREYIKLLLRACNTKITICENSKVNSFNENSEQVIVSTKNSGTISADNVVIATNGFYQDNNLQGLLEPRFTFMKSYKDEGKDTPGCWTAGKNYFYFTRQDNTLIVGALDIPVNPKGPFKIDETEYMQQVQNLAQQRFPNAKQSNVECIHFGAYARTKDELPIVGKFNDKSKVTYIVGCNAIGHTTYNVAARIIPSILGYSEFNSQDKKFAEFLSPKRKTLSN